MTLNEKNNLNGVITEQNYWYDPRMIIFPLIVSYLYSELIFFYYLYFMTKQENLTL